MADTKDTILKAASILFGRDGYAATGVAALALEAGVTKRTLYQHFGSKDGVFLAWLSERDLQTRGLSMAAAERMSDAPDGQLFALFDILASFADMPNFYGCPFSRAILEFSGSEGHAAMTFSAEHKQAIEHWIRTRVQQISPSNEPVLTDQVCVLYEGVLLRMVITGSSSQAFSAKSLLKVILKN